MGGLDRNCSSPHSLAPVRYDGIVAAMKPTLIALLALCLCVPVVGADEFAQLHSLLKPQPGESRWMEIDWHPRVWEARSKAAAEGKPLFFMAGSGGAPAAGC